jgi:hypothetical protein
MIFEWWHVDAYMQKHLLWFVHVALAKYWCSESFHSLNISTTALRLSKNVFKRWWKQQTSVILIWLNIQSNKDGEGKQSLSLLFMSFNDASNVYMFYIEEASTLLLNIHALVCVILGFINVMLNMIVCCSHKRMDIMCNFCWCNLHVS